MKKLSKKREEWLDLNVKRKSKRQIKISIALKRLCLGKNFIKHYKCSVFSMPQNLLAENEEQRKLILDVIFNIQKSLENSNDRIKIDFSKVSHIYPGGMLILIAWIQLFHHIFPGRIFASCPSGSLAGQLINHFGIGSILGVNPFLNKPHDDSVVNWNYLTGTIAEGEKINNLLDKYREKTNAEIPEGLFAALTEALVNVRHHAYEGSVIHEDFQKWWLFSQYVEPIDKNPGGLYIAIYDIGMGIPYTMKRQIEKGEIILDMIDKFGSVLKLSNGTLLDKNLLSEAVEKKRSQTGQPHRGNGLPEMRELVESTTNGRLCIISGKAQYTSFGGKNRGQAHSIHSKFPGTLLLWSLPLTPKDSQL